MSAVIATLAAASFVAAIVHQASATHPIGEGEVFVVDAERAAALITAEGSPDDAVRHVRNLLDIEAVSLVGPDGVVAASTSDNLIGHPITNPLLAYGAGAGRFAALASAIDVPVEIDGVVEWPAGSVLYQVISPLEPEAGPDEGLVMLHYEVAELLSRRAQPGDIQTLTLQLLALGAVFTLLAVTVFVGHARAARRHREMTTESQLLRTQAEELELANAELAEARKRAERALALSEEKMRIRSEFVLMINHELRTPLTSVVTGAELVRGGDLGPEESKEVLDSMVANGKRLNEIIDQILAVARIENQGLSNELVAIPLPDICAVTGAALVSSGELREIDVRTDVRTLSLIVSSLADNARTHGAAHVEIRCVFEQTIEPMVEIGNRPTRPVFILVADDGPGIDPEFLPRAFEKFEKNSASSGTGLGLYMVRLMVEAIDGSIAVTTSARGTTFQIALPARVDERVLAKT